MGERDRKMECYKCGDNPESGKSFIPVDEPGTPNRRWVCTDCADLIQKQQAKNAWGKRGLRLQEYWNQIF